MNNIIKIIKIYLNELKSPLYVIKFLRYIEKRRNAAKHTNITLKQLIYFAIK